MYVYTYSSTVTLWGVTGTQTPSNPALPLATMPLDTYLPVPKREFFIDNLLVRIHDDFSRPALRHGSLNALSQAALYLPS